MPLNQRIGLSDRPRIARRARLRFDARTQQHLLLSPERALVLNRTAASIVCCCTGGNTVAQICREVARGQLSALVQADVLTFLEALHGRRLLDLLGRPS